MKDFWNKRYAEDGMVYGEKPNVFLTEVIDKINPAGSLLVVGDGEGRNGVWLAEQGFDVTSIDYSPIAVEKISRLADQRKVDVDVICADLSEWQWPQEQFDAIVSIYVHFPPEIRKRMHHFMLSALKPGGKILMEAFNRDQLQYSSGGPPVLEMLFSEEILLTDFANADIELMYEKVVTLDEGEYHSGDGAIVRMIAKR